MSRIKLGSGGWLYAITSSSLYANGDGLIKIGQTTLDPHERARQLSSSTSAATPFYVLYAKKTEDANEAEFRAHELLDPFRINDSREFFRIDARQAIETIDRVCGEYVNLPDLSFAELFNSFPDREDGVLNDEEIAACRKLERSLAR